MSDFISVIRKHLEQRAQEDASFASKFNERMALDKNAIMQCCSYIVNEVRKKHSNGNSGVLTHSEVFGMAVHFFDENIKADGNISKCKVVVSRSDLTPDEIEIIKSEARDAVKNEVLEEEKKKERERLRREAEKARKAEVKAQERRKEKEEKARKEFEEGMSLFGEV